MTISVARIVKPGIPKKNDLLNAVCVCNICSKDNLDTAFVAFC